jgi:protein gp37
LLETRAAVRFLSCEPLLGPVDLSPVLHGLDWVIVGGESGKGARPCEEAWVREIVTDCQAEGVPVFVKQMGSSWAYRHGADSKGGDPSYWPTDLQVREFPAAELADLKVALS